MAPCPLWPIETRCQKHLLKKPPITLPSQAWIVRNPRIPLTHQDRLKKGVLKLSELYDLRSEWIKGTLRKRLTELISLTPLFSQSTGLTELRPMVAM